jgi:hypothetical protein
MESFNLTLSITPIVVQILALALAAGFVAVLTRVDMRTGMKATLGHMSQFATLIVIGGLGVDSFLNWGFDIGRSEQLFPIQCFLFVLVGALLT